MIYLMDRGLDMINDANDKDFTFLWVYSKLNSSMHIVTILVQNFVQAKKFLC
jgi:hypothetical protein